jgi:hypothetical protein
MRYKLVKFLSMDKAVLKKNKNEYYVASFADVPYSGPEVLVFPADKNGAIMDYGEVDGGPGYKSLSDFITEKCVAI